MQAGTYFSTMDTAIIVFTDDIILLSPSLKGLQCIVDKCVKLGNEHLIEFKDKIQFVK